jgi:hypothetical protein
VVEGWLTGGKIAKKCGKNEMEIGGKNRAKKMPSKIDG